MKETYSREEVIIALKKLRRECCKMEMLHIIAKLNMDEKQTRAYYADMAPEIRMFTTAILTIDVTQYL